MNDASRARGPLGARPGGPAGPARPPGAPQVWARDLAMGVRFACTGGREGWTRTLLTAVGVGLGVALLLITTALPNALSARHLREDARTPVAVAEGVGPGPATLLTMSARQEYRGQDIDGMFVQAEGAAPAVPPGLRALPAPGELAVSPALAELLASDEGRLLRERLGGRITQTIGDAGLVGPGELCFYAGTDLLRPPAGGIETTQRVAGFSGKVERKPLDPILNLLILLTFVALLMPVVVFIAAAVRSGGERRDRRLAALRLVGADTRTVRRIAAGEALAGALAGLGLGTVFFLAGRELVRYVHLYQRDVFPADLDPAGWLLALVAVAVPLLSVAVTLFTMRRVVVEPLGVVRTARRVRRRIWWRLLMPVAGLALLAPLMGEGRELGDFSQWQVGAGVVLLLVGVTALLPWLLERLVGRLGAGPVSWQLGIRRLQVNSGPAARLVNGVAVAVAGAIALQMMFTGVGGGYAAQGAEDGRRGELTVFLRDGAPAGGEWDRVAALGARLGEARGIASATALSRLDAAVTEHEKTATVDITVGTCEALREVAVLGPCAEGDSFVLPDGGPYGVVPEPGQRLFTGNVTGLSGGAPAVPWTVPAAARHVTAREDPGGDLRTGVLVTPSAAPQGVAAGAVTQVHLRLDHTVPDAMEEARVAVHRAEPLAYAGTFSGTEDARYATIRAGLFFGAAAVLVLIGTSLLLSQVEQLRERRRLLSTLVAFGTRRSTLSLSVLWQTAVPVALGLALASAVGVTLGTVLLRMSGVPVRVDWASVLAMSGIGAGMIAAVTLFSLPSLLRLMRPDGLRTE
ncbi:ABC transporter permease [Streptomyces sp. NPDC090022]|uniref:ABC transporter permease n=1 Tax=Streptomyces sp. NPDC090022 TaxID=3365920 RepID=UPI00381ED716